MSKNWDERAKTWDRDERVRSYADQAFLALIEHVNVSDGEWKSKRALDFGCGTGLLTEKLAPLVREVIAVDTSPDMIDVLRNKEIHNVTTFCSDIDDDTVRSSATWLSGFDLIVASSVCNFLPDYEKTIGLLSRTLKPRGKIAQWDWLASDDGKYGMTIERISNAFSRADLCCVYVDEVFSVTFDEETLPVLMGNASAK